MKVLHLNSEKSWRGGEQQMAYLAIELKKNAVESTLGFNHKNSRLYFFAKENAMNAVHIPFGGLQILASLKLLFWLKKNKVDLIHTHTAKAHTVAVWANILGANTPIVVSKRTDFKVKSPYKFLHPSVKAILCVSEMIKKITTSGLPAKCDDKIHTVYSGVNIHRFNQVEQKSLKKSYNIDEDKILIGNCSAIAPHKDYKTFVDTAEILINKLPEVFHFMIIGDGPDEQMIKDYVKSKGLDSKITFTGFISDLESYLKSLDLFLMTSEEEGLGTSLLDAMLCEIPIVTTQAGGIPEIVIDQQTGLTAPVKDHVRLAQLVEMIIQKPELRQNLIQNAKRLVIEDFSKENTAQKTFSFYKRI